MPLDSICLGALKTELENDIVGMRIDKVQQPERDTLVLSLRGNGKNVKLLICAGTGNARLHITESTFENPASPPMFCMLMRKHLVGARIKSLYQPSFERVIELNLETVDQLGILSDKKLCVELMGSASNIVLCDENGLIIDCMRRISGELELSRRVLPGLFYRLPERQDKRYLDETEKDEIDSLIKTSNPDKQADKWVISTFAGLSPLICRELVYKSYGRTDIRMEDVLIEDRGEALLCEIEALKEMISSESFTPTMLTEESGKPKDFSFMSIGQYEMLYGVTNTKSFSNLLDGFYSGRDKIESMRRKALLITKTVKSVRDRTARRLALQTEELKKTENRDEYRKCGDIIMANIYAMKKRMTVLKAVDFYSEDGAEIEIKLDPMKTPQENAAKYYKDYNKAKNARTHLTELTKSGEIELDYLNSVLDAIERAESDRDIQEIRQELVDAGYIRKQKQSKKEKRIEQKPLHFRSSSGVDIWVGKNNAQNERLTHKTALKQDIWLHTQKIHGSHVIISLEGRDLDDATLIEAASLAAYYSQGREAPKVPVDYTRIKFVKKQPGGKLGMVIYTDYKTIITEPSDELVDKLMVR